MSSSCQCLQVACFVVRCFAVSVLW